MKDTLLSDLFVAYFDARRHKRNSRSQLAFETDLETNLMELYRQICSREYKVGLSSCFMVLKPVKREVFAADFRDRVVHHLIYNYIAPMLEAGFINDSYSCRVGRGTLYGTKRLDYHIKSCTENGTKTAWILKLDIQGYFMNIDRSILYEKVWKVVCKNKNRKALCGQKWGEKLDYNLLQFLLREVIFNDPTQNCIVKGSIKDWVGLPRDKSLFHTPKGCGLPIGNLTSQLFSNVYLNDFDNYCKRTLKIKHYGRYVDDFYVVHNSREFLRGIIPIIETYLKTNLKLQLHPKKRYLQLSTHGVQFLGSKVNGHSILAGDRIRKGVLQTVYRANEHIRFKPCQDTPTSVCDFVERMNSYLGIMTHNNSYEFRGRLLSKISPDILQYTTPSPDRSKMVLHRKPVIKLLDPLAGDFEL